MAFKLFNACRKIDIEYLFDYVDEYETEFEVEVQILLVNQQTYEELNEISKVRGYQIAINPKLRYGEVELVTSK